MLINIKKIKEIEAEQKGYKKKLSELDIELKFPMRKKTKDFLMYERHMLCAKICGCTGRVGIEKTRHNYTSANGYDKIKELSKYLGKEIKSAFISDKNTPQILLGLRYDSGEANYSSPQWLGTIRYCIGGKTETKEIFISTIKPVKKI